MNKKKTFMVIYDGGQGGVWFLMDAYSKEDIENLRPEFFAYDNEHLPVWMTSERKKEFLEYCKEQKHHWDIDKEPTGWLAMCLSQPLPKGSTPSEMIQTLLNLNGNDINDIVQKTGVSKECILNIVRGKTQPSLEQKQMIRSLIKQKIAEVSK